MRRLEVPGRITGLDTARAVAILGMIATHIYPLLQADESGRLAPTWVGVSLTGVSSALFVVLAGVGLTLLTKRSTDVFASRMQLSLRAIVLIAIGLVLGHAGSNVAIILVHYGVLFFCAMWFITLSRKALTITALAWLILAPLFHGVFTRFMQLQAGGTTAYVDGWRLWTSPTLFDVIQQPLLTLWDILFTGYYPVISFLGYVLLGMSVGRANLQKWSSGLRLFVVGTVAYVVFRGMGALLLTDTSYVSRVSHVTGVSVDELPAMAATGAGINTDFLMGAPQWFGLAVPHSGAPFDIYSTAGAAVAVIGLFLLLARVGVVRKLLFPVTAAGMVALTAYVVHVIITGLWQTAWTQTVQIGDPVMTEVWTMLLVHWVLVIAIGVVVYFLGVRGPLEALLRKISTAGSTRH